MLNDYKQALQQKVDNIDRIILSLNTIQQTNRNYKFEIQQIRDNINSQTIKLKEIIENKSKELISKLIGEEANFNRKLIDIDSYISSLNFERDTLKDIIKEGSDYVISSAKLYIRFQTDALILKHKKFIQIKRPIFTMPLIDAESLQAKDLFGSIQNIQIDGMIDILKNETLSKVYLTKFLLICAMKQDLFILDIPNIHVFDMHLNKFKSSIHMKINIANNCSASDIIGISNVLFILFDMDGIKSIIYKFNFQNDICSEWKTMKLCRISSTNHATILATTLEGELIEFSLNGHQLKLIKFYTPFYTPLGCFSTSYQLVDGRYVATDEDEHLCNLYLIDSEGNVIKKNSIIHSGYTTMCTDYDKYIFVCDRDRNIIIVFSTDLHKIREFYFNSVFTIIYDRENKRILGRNADEILYFNYNEKSIKDI